MIKIITIEREYGSGGGEIAQLVAQQLGWKLWDHLLTEEIAKLANCPKAVVEVREERADPLYYRLFISFLRGSYEGSLNAHKLKVVDSESILKITQRVVEQVSKEGNSVIVGRGSQHFLMHRKTRCDACWLVARVKRMPNNSWIRSIAIDGILYKNISAWNGRTVAFITR